MPPKSLMSFTLTMHGAVVNDQIFDCIIIQWTKDVSREEIFKLLEDCNRANKQSLITRFTGLDSVGRLELSIKSAD